MTTAEKIEGIQKELEAAEEVVAEINGRLKDAKTEQFRERHGYGLLDWVLLDGVPARVAYGYSGWRVEYDHVIVRRVTKAGKMSLRTDTIYGDLEKHISPWPAGRPLPEVKP